MKKSVIFVLIAVVTAVAAASSACRPLRTSQPGEDALIGISPELGEKLEREYNESHAAGN